MLHTVLIVTLLWAFQFTGIQGEVKFSLEKFQITYADEKYFGGYDAYVVDDQSITLNMSIIKTTQERIFCSVKMFGNSKGEYDLISEFEMEMKLCEFVANPFFVGPILGNMGIDSGNCPPKPGIYGVSNYKLDMNGIPDTFPPNQYLATFETKVGDQVVCILEMYLRIY